jgi:hypothetical protein
MKKTLLAVCMGLTTVAQADTTYVDAVANIINDNCVVCHREGGIGPMSFETYEQVRPGSSTFIGIPHLVYQDVTSC